jgi:hypothetical protein
MLKMASMNGDEEVGEWAGWNILAVLLLIPVSLPLAIFVARLARLGAFEIALGLAVAGLLALSLLYLARALIRE